MTMRDPNPNTPAAPQATEQGSDANLHNTHSELLREAAEDASDGRIVDESRRAGDPNYSRDIASSELSEREVAAAYPPSARAEAAKEELQRPADRRDSGVLGIAAQRDGSPHAANQPPHQPHEQATSVPMDTELGEELLEGDLAGTEQAQVVRSGQTVGAAAGSARPKERFVIVGGQNKQPGLLHTLRERVQENLSEWQDKGEQLAFAAKLKLEMRQLESDREALFTRLGRAYFRRAEPDVLAVIENELRRIERDICICEGQIEAHQRHTERAKARREHEQLSVRYPRADSSAATAFEMRAQAPRIQHEIGTAKRDTFFGLDKGGVDEQATVLGGNAAFDTQRGDTDSALTIADLPEDKR